MPSLEHSAVIAVATVSSLVAFAQLFHTLRKENVEDRQSVILLTLVAAAIVFFITFLAFLAAEAASELNSDAATASKSHAHSEPSAHHEKTS
ncbi:hypothetical protein BWQ96_10130 [Gracilariopsis chorda]|uniref:Uncharacterized protein n=1 Tax=Gracilariopsis chorda TaxID=448386 RepID=A0A2V3IDN1_9FLOR|nr:hypothetical protein BWQ96_10130 [Gracilariopsis chorda]|eukprot:PXF40162.1 hypothetical protein BWQ96_10130 [Gracilariopsis chorda]